MVLGAQEMNKKKALRILKMLSGLEVIVFQQSNVPDHLSDELIAIIDELSDFVLEVKNEN